MSDATRDEMAGSTVLVVDDTEANRYTLTRLLQRAGYRTLEAADGAGAMRGLAAQPDLVVLDVQLPDMLGFDVCRRIKALPDAPKVLQTSASFIRSEDRVEGIEGGADAYLVQPLHSQEFLATVRSLLRLRHAEKELHAANRCLERSNRDLEHFARIASHDLQEPLRTISSFLSVLETRYGVQLDDHARRYIAHAMAGAQRMRAMVRGLLEFSQIQRSVAEASDIAADDALDDGLRNLELVVAESGARIRREPLPRVRADRNELARVFQNLLSNAIKFRARERVPEIQVSATSDGAIARFTVADNGVGIPREGRQRLFQLFNRGTTARDLPGVGIGLATFRSIVERLGGQVGVESEPGVGSSFWFTLPRPAGADATSPTTGDESKERA